LPQILGVCYSQGPLIHGKKLTGYYQNLLRRLLVENVVLAKVNVVEVRNVFEGDVEAKVVEVLRDFADLHNLAHVLHAGPLEIVDGGVAEPVVELESGQDGGEGDGTDQKPAPDFEISLARNHNLKDIQ